MLSIAWSLLLDTAPWVLVGFAIAALLDGLLSADRWLGRLRGEGPRATVLATLMGAPLPLCSCAVLPAALTLRRRGLGRGPTLSFLVSTPETSVTSVLLSYALLGPVFAVVRPVAALVTAISAGLVEGAFGRDDGHALPDAPATCCDDDGHGHEHVHDEPAATDPSSRLRRAARFAFVDLFDDLFGWVIVGVLFAAALTAWIPDEAFATLFGSPALTLLAVIVVGVPLYVCAEASTPIAAAFVAEGLSPGAALVFLLVGPATNLGSLGALAGVFGRRSVALYLVSIVAVALAMGLGVDALLGADAVRLGEVTTEGAAAASPLAVGATLVFLALGAASLVRTNALGRVAASLDRALPIAVTPARAAAGLAGAALLAWGATGVHVVPPGHVAVVERLGVVVEHVDRPGPLLRWPTPVETVDVVDVRSVRRTALDDAWTLTADENLGDVDVVVHWSLTPDPTDLATRRVADPETLVASVTRAALGERVARTGIGALLTTARADVERDVRDATQRQLARHGAGIEIAAVTITSDHAPDDVHDAFRDVAGAVEQRATSRARAEARRARTIPMAHAEAAAVREAAHAEAARITADATARAERFVALTDATVDSRALTRRRLELEMLERVLPRLRTYLGDDRSLELWFSDPSDGAPKR